MDEKEVLTIFTRAEVDYLKLRMGLTKTHFSESAMSVFASFAVYRNNTKALRFLISHDITPKTFVFFTDNYPFNECQKLLLDYGLATFSLRPRYNDKANQFCASKKRARKGAIVTLYAVRLGKDVARIIARVVWESRGFYSLVSRKEWIKRK